jgi:excisionase family DNA binding protein
MAKTPDFSTWMTKQQAAEILAVSTKQIERWANDKRLQCGKWKRPEGGPAIVVYHPADIERIAQDRNPGVEPFVLPAAAASPKPTNGAHALAVRQPSGEQFIEALAAAVSSMSQTSKTPSARLWLTLEEAADYSGLPAAAIVHFIESKALKALNVGRRRGGQWRIRRLDLDQFAG